MNIDWITTLQGCPQEERFTPLGATQSKLSTETATFLPDPISKGITLDP